MLSPSSSALSNRHRSSKASNGGYKQVDKNDETKRMTKRDILIFASQTVNQRSVRNRCVSNRS